MDAKSGVSGAGRGGSVDLNFSEVNENFKAYNLDGHRHHPEIVQELGDLNGGSDETHVPDSPRTHDSRNPRQLLRTPEVG